MRTDVKTGDRFWTWMIPHGVIEAVANGNSNGEDICFDWYGREFFDTGCQTFATQAEAEADYVIHLGVLQRGQQIAIDRLLAQRTNLYQQILELEEDVAERKQIRDGYDDQIARLKGSG